MEFPPNVIGAGQAKIGNSRHWKNGKHDVYYHLATFFHSKENEKVAFRLGIS